MTTHGHEWPRVLPMFPLGSVVLPGVAIPLHVFEPRYRALVMTCLTDDRQFGSVLIERGSEVGGGDVRADTGTLVRLLDAEETPDGRWAVVGVGLERLRVVEWLPDDPFPRCIAEPWPDDITDDPIEPQLRATMDDLGRLLEAMSDDSSQRSEDLANALSADAATATFQLAALAPISTLDRLEALRSPNPASRLAVISGAVNERLETIRALRALEEPEPDDR